MYKREKQLIILYLSFILLLQILFLNFKLASIHSSSGVIIVGEDYDTIQEAINAANPGDTIIVKEGVYFEFNILINKSITLIGENPTNTIIDGQETERPIIVIISPNVRISNFTIMNTTKMRETYGIMIHNAVNVTLANNIIKENYWGICIENSSECKIINNTIINNVWGITFRNKGSSNNIIYNNIINNQIGVSFLDFTCENNIFYHNNLINNTHQTSLFLGKNTQWDNGAEGNYWSDYTGEDTDGNGIGDTPYPVPTSPIDNYPLMEPWKPVRTYTINEYKVTIYSNFTVASFNYSEEYRQVSFYVTGPKNKPGFCNITIPKALLNISENEEWLILIEDKNVTDTVKIKSQTTKTSLYIPINVNGLNLTTQKIRIRIVEKEETNIPPLAKFTFKPTQPKIFESITFLDNSTDPDGTLTSRIWNFGDGNITETNATIIIHTYTKVGTYIVTLTVKDDKNAIDTATAHITVRKLTSTLTINVYPSTIIIGNYTTISGTLTPQKEANITIYYRIQNEENWRILDVTKTNNQGNYMYQWAPDKCGVYEIMASWEGDQETKPANSSIVILEVTKILSELTIELAPLPATVKTNITISGKLKPKITNATIIISYLLYPPNTPELWTYLTIAKTDENGTYKCYWTPVKAGCYIIMASWRGNDITFGANATTGPIFIDRLSSNITIDVEPKNTTIGLEIEINGKITPARAYVNITIKISVNNITLHTKIVKTDQKGNFHYSWFPNEEGVYEIMASWEGDQETKPANSEKVTVYVKKMEKQNNQNLTSYYYCIPILMAILLLSYSYLRKRRKKGRK